MFLENVHYSTELEKAIIGAILLEPTALGRIYGILEKDVFYHDRHKKIFSVCLEMWSNSEPIDLLTATIRLFKKGFSDLDGDNTAYYLAGCTTPVCSTANLEYHALILRQMYVDREVMVITNSGMGDKNGIEYIDELQDKLIKIRQIKNTDDFKDIDEILVNLYSHMQTVQNQELSGITTGFSQIDKITGGMEPGGMYIVAARPSCGKSAFMGKMSLMAARKGHKVAIISLEMEDVKITARIASIVSDLDFWRINRGRMYDKQQSDYFYEVMNSQLANLPIKISDKASVSIGDIKSKVARLKQRDQVDILFIDYLGLIDTDGTNRNQNREQEVSKISRGIKLMAMQFGIPIVLLCQLNRLSEQGTDKKPKLHNLRESGSLEQDADGVIFIHRDFMSGIKINHEGQSTENEADAIIAKWRNGELAEIKLGFEGSKMKFYELQQQSTFVSNKQLENFEGF